LIGTGFRDLFDQSLLTARFLDRSLQLDQKQLAGDIKDGRHTALPNWNRN
jgi:hypothetical protein